MLAPIVGQNRFYNSGSNNNAAALRTDRHNITCADIDLYSIAVLLAKTEIK
jgi:hypothetical protein